jgi:hypothetical protein
MDLFPSEIAFIQTEGSNDYLKAYLSQIEQCILTSCGPNGKSKLLSNSISNSFRITNQSKYIIEYIYNLTNIKIHIKNQNAILYIKWLFDLILSAYQRNATSFYDSGLFSCHLLNQLIIRSQNESSSHANYLNECLRQLLSHLHALTATSQLFIKTDLVNIKFLYNLISTIFNSKNSIKSSANANVDTSKFTNLCLTAFLNSFSETSLSFAHLYYLVDVDFNTNLDDSFLLNGILVKINSDSVFKLTHATTCKKTLKCVMFGTQLSADYELFDNADYEIEVDASAIGANQNTFILVNQLRKLCDVLLEKSVDVVLCQKVGFYLVLFF